MSFNPYYIPRVTTSNLAPPKLFTPNPLAGLTQLLQSQNALMRGVGGGGGGRGGRRGGGSGDEGHSKNARRLDLPRADGKTDIVWVEATTAKERDRKAEELYQQRLNDILQQDASVAGKLAKLPTASVPAQKEITDSLRREDMPRLEKITGVRGDVLLGSTLKNAEALTQKREKAIENSGWGVGSMLRQAGRNTFAAIKALGADASERQKIFEATNKANQEDVAKNNPWAEEQIRLQQEGREADFFDSPGRSIVQAATPIVTTAVPAVLGGVAGSLVPGLGTAVGAAMGAALGGGLGGAAFGGSDAALRAVNEGKSAQEISDAFSTGAAISGAIGAVPIGPLSGIGALGRGFAASAALRGAAKGVGAVPVSTGGRVAQAMANRKAVGTLMARQAAENAANRTWKQNALRGYLTTAGDAAALGAGEQIASNIGYNTATGSNSSWTEGVPEQLALGGVMGLLGLRGGRGAIAGRINDRTGLTTLENSSANRIQQAAQIADTNAGKSQVAATATASEPPATSGRLTGTQEAVLRAANADDLIAQMAQFTGKPVELEGAIRNHFIRENPVISPSDFVAKVKAFTDETSAKQWKPKGSYYKTVNKILSEYVEPPAKQKGKQNAAEANKPAVIEQSGGQPTAAMGADEQARQGSVDTANLVDNSPRAEVAKADATTAPEQLPPEAVNGGTAVERRGDAGAEAPLAREAETPPAAPSKQGANATQKLDGESGTDTAAAEPATTSARERSNQPAESAGDGNVGDAAAIGSVELVARYNPDTNVLSGKNKMAASAERRRITDTILAEARDADDLATLLKHALDNNHTNKKLVEGSINPMVNPNLEGWRRETAQRVTGVKPEKASMVPAMGQSDKKETKARRKKAVEDPAPEMPPVKEKTLQEHAAEPESAENLAMYDEALEQRLYDFKLENVDNLEIIDAAVSHMEHYKGDLAKVFKNYDIDETPALATRLMVKNAMDTKALTKTEKADLKKVQKLLGGAPAKAPVPPAVWADAVEQAAEYNKTTTGNKLEPVDFIVQDTVGGRERMTKLGC